MPLISVIMATYNNAQSIDRAIGSVRCQTVADWELLIVDDASVDETRERVAPHLATDSRVKYIRQDHNAGPAVARNLGLRLAQGTWVGILDADDAYRPNRLEKLMRLTDDHSPDLVYDNQIFFDFAAGRETGFAFLPRNDQRVLTLKEFLLSETQRGRSLGFIKPLIRRSFLERNGIRYQPDLRFAEDFRLYAEILLKGGRALATAEPFYIYTKQVGDLTGTASPVSRTKFDPWIRVRIAKELRSEYFNGLDRSDRDAFERYERYVTQYAHAYEMSEHKKSLRFRSMFRTMLSHPKAAWRFILTHKPLRWIFNTGW